MQKRFMIGKFSSLTKQQPLQPAVDYAAKLNELRISGTTYVPDYALREMQNFLKQHQAEASIAGIERQQGSLCYRFQTKEYSTRKVVLRTYRSY